MSDLVDKIHMQRASIENINNVIVLLTERLHAKNNSVDLAENNNAGNNNAGNNNAESDGSENNHSDNNHNKDSQSMKSIINTINKLIPDKMLINNYIEQISILAFKTKLKLLALKIRKENVLGKIISLPIELTLLGKYNDINYFLHGLESAHRFSVIKNFAITKFNENNSELLKVKIVVNIYFYL